jgi:hypothetical protein
MCAKCETVKAKLDETITGPAADQGIKVTFVALEDDNSLNADELDVIGTTLCAQSLRLAASGHVTEASSLLTLAKKIATIRNVGGMVCVAPF